ncbi:MAG: hypothetical protein ACO3LE_11305, partial [Bdellovibrionota bacterium]
VLRKKNAEKTLFFVLALDFHPKSSTLVIMNNNLYNKEGQLVKLTVEGPSPWAVNKVFEYKGFTLTIECVREDDNYWHDEIICSADGEMIAANLELRVWWHDGRRARGRRNLDAFHAWVDERVA